MQPENQNNQEKGGEAYDSYLASLLIDKLHVKSAESSCSVPEENDSSI